MLEPGPVGRAVSVLLKNAPEGRGKKVEPITLFLCIKPTETEKNNGYVVFE